MLLYRNLYKSDACYSSDHTCSWLNSAGCPCEQTDAAKPSKMNTAADMPPKRKRQPCMALTGCLCHACCGPSSHWTLHGCPAQGLVQRCPAWQQWLGQPAAAPPGVPGPGSPALAAAQQAQHWALLQQHAGLLQGCSGSGIDIETWLLADMQGQQCYVQRLSCSRCPNKRRSPSGRSWRR